MAKKKIKKAILAGLAAYAGAKMLGGKGTADWRKNLKHTYGKLPIKHDLGDGKVMESVYKAKHFRKPSMLGDVGKSMDHMSGSKKWWQFWKKHGGVIKSEHARLGKMIKASQGTYAREDESIGMRLGAKKTKHDKKVARDESYGDWGKRKKDWAKKGKMVKARYGTEVRTDGSNPHVPAGGTAYVRTKLNGTLKTKTY